MSRKMLIDAAHPEETRVVVVENNRVEEFDYESAARKPIRGNIYLAKVTRVEPSLQAAFVEYGGNKHGFLAFNEIHPDYYQIPHADREALRAQEAELTASMGEDAGGDEDADPVQDEDDLIDEASRRRRNFMRKYKIQEVIKRRQVLLVQVAKEERGNKGAALTTYLSLAGRYCVLMPNTARGGGISRKITNAPDRKRLKSAVSELSVPGGMGLIIRTAGASRTKTEIKRDYEYLIRLWENIRETTLKSMAPSLIYEEGNLVKRTIRDLYDKDIDEVLVEGEEAYKEAKAFMRMLMPSHAKKVQHYKDDAPLFLRHQVESQLEAIHSPTAQLKSGGYIVINPTEALVAIDVNSGKSTKERGIEQTATRTNLEAAEEAARQMRLRDLAGLVVIDFIDMDESKNVRAVEKKMKDALKRDRARLQVGRISQFGLMELSRQRRRTSLVEGSTGVCPHCEGTGYIRSIESSALVALRTLEEEGVRGRSAHVRINCPTEVALYLLNEKRDHLNAIEQRYALRVTVKADDGLNRPACTLERLEAAREGARPAVRPAAASQIDEAAEAALDAAAEAAAAADEAAESRQDQDVEEAPAAKPRRAEPAERAEAEGDDEGGRKRRRRGRRGGRNRRRRDGADGPDATQDADNAPGQDGEDSGVLNVVEPTGGDAFDSGEAPPRRERPARRRRRGSGDAPETGAAADSAAAPADAAEAEIESLADEAPAPKTRRRRRKAAPAEAAESAQSDVKADAAPEAGADAPAAEAEAAPAKPKRRTRAKSAAADKADKAETPAKPRAKAKAKAKPEPEAGTEAKPEAGDETASKPRRTRARPKAKPAAETASSDAPETSEPASPAPEKAEPAADEPRRTGWWQRSSKILGLK
ncbi:ribonuclease E/G [Alkalicaulis satelles]|uniref:Ribonuclease E n=1 Tax=Alkalicaulis satelles TaxID=2609175 RepID=A0A5M6ZLW0_9PROT|nr:ribonuclease E/G [Alkalicaulis satelles]KAA5804667.1 ribonuclease E/G [Alkalicaulis satelles]